MTVSKIFTELGLINDNTEVWIRDNDLHVLAHGNWYQDNVLRYLDNEVESFTWQDDNNFYIDIFLTQSTKLKNFAFSSFFLQKNNV